MTENLTEQPIEQPSETTFGEQPIEQPAEPAFEAPSAPTRPARPDPEEWWNDKGEKDEKEEEKTREKSEKPRDVGEKWRQDPVSGVVFSAILIMAGFVLILDNLNVPIFRNNGWSIALVFAGLLVALGAAVRVLMPEYRRPIRSTLIVATVLVGIGLGNLLGWAIVWPLIIIAVGVGILLTGLLRKQ